MAFRNNKKNSKDLQEKLNRVKSVSSQLEISESLNYSIEDLNDAFIDMKMQDVKEKMDNVLERLSKCNSSEEYHRLYDELEKYEEISYLLNRKHSKQYLKAMKQKNKD